MPLVDLVRVVVVLSVVEAASKAMEPLVASAPAVVAARGCRRRCRGGLRARHGFLGLRPAAARAPRPAVPPPAAPPVPVPTSSMPNRLPCRTLSESRSVDIVARLRRIWQAAGGISFSSLLCYNDKQTPRCPVLAGILSWTGKARHPAKEVRYGNHSRQNHPVRLRGYRLVRRQLQHESLQGLLPRLHLLRLPLLLLPGGALRHRAGQGKRPGDPAPGAARQAAQRHRAHRRYERSV